MYKSKLGLLEKILNVPLTKEQEDIKRLQKEVSLNSMHHYQIKKLIINSLIFLLLGLITGLLL